MRARFVSLPDSHLVSTCFRVLSNICGDCAIKRFLQENNAIISERDFASSCAIVQNGAFMTFRKSTLGNGATLITDAMPGVRSATVGLWFNVGSRDERKDQAGLTHFMEHMMFKGTHTRTAFDISSEFDALGAELNAFTSKEYTCYYAHVVDEKLSNALEILADMVVNSQFSDETIEPERKVVVEEIARSEDQPDDVAFETFSSAIMRDHPLGLPILGTREHVMGYDHEKCSVFHREHYFSGNLTIAVAGNVDHEQLLEWCEGAFADMKQGEKHVRALEAPAKRDSLAVVKKDTEQAHILYGFPYISNSDDRAFIAGAFSSMLGGSMSSRLFQEVREKRGLVYTISTVQSRRQGAGSFAVYAGTRPENIEEVVEITRRELDKMARCGTDREELDKTIESLCGQMLLGLESTMTRMSRIGRPVTLDLPLLTPEQMVERYRAITCDDIADFAHEILTADPTIAIVSPHDENEIRAMIAPDAQ